RVVGRMAGVAEAPEDVRDAVRELEVMEEEARLLREEAAKHLAVLLRGLADVLEERLLVERAGLDRPRVDRPPHRLVAAETALELAGERGRWRGSEPGGQAARVELDRREVEVDLGVDARQPRAGVAVDRHERVDAEGEREPVAPLAGLELGARRAGLDHEPV